ncbi:MAG: hypothetical protein Kow00106_13700 [Anaerolineae bacterium]
MRPIAIALAICLGLSACAGVTETRERVNTVNKAVALLQAVDDRDAWQLMNDAMDDLFSAQTPFSATIQVQTSSLSLSWQWQVDADGDQRIDDLTVTAAPHSYLLPADSAQAYRLDAQDTACVLNGHTAELVRAGLRGLLERAGFEQVNAQALAVLAAPQEVEVAGRAATRYELRARLPDAVALLDAYDDRHAPQLRSAARTVNLSGHMIRDDSTGALLELAISGSDADTGESAAIDFVVIQWGTVPDIPRPDTIIPCE